MKCRVCGHELEDHEHYVKTYQGTVLCESCFFDSALEILFAKSMQRGFEEYDEED